MIGLFLFPREVYRSESRGEIPFRGEGCDTLGVCTIKTAFVCYASCVNCLKKDLFCKYKGYMCNYDFMQGPFYSFI